MWTEERKLLEYHRGRGVFYPLIQVQTPAPARAAPSRAAASGGAGEGSGEPPVGTHLPVMVAVVCGVLLVLWELSMSLSPDAWLRALVSCAVLVLSLLSADRARLSGKDPKYGGLASWLGSLGGSPSDPRPSTQRGDSQPVKALAWHPHLNMFAVALADASMGEYVKFYDMDAEQWLQTVIFTASLRFLSPAPPTRLLSDSNVEPPVHTGCVRDTHTHTHTHTHTPRAQIVKHQFQSAISCLEFQPHGGSNIAVACQEGIGIWQLEPAHHASPRTDQLVASDNCLSAWMSWYGCICVLSCLRARARARARASAKCRPIASFPPHPLLATRLSAD